jgi:hypothetical protein
MPGCQVPLNCSSMRKIRQIDHAPARLSVHVPCRAQLHHARIIISTRDQRKKQRLCKGFSRYQEGPFAPPESAGPVQSSYVGVSKRQRTDEYPSLAGLSACHRCRTTNRATDKQTGRQVDRQPPRHQQDNDKSKADKGSEGLEETRACKNLQRRGRQGLGLGSLAIKVVPTLQIFPVLMIHVLLGRLPERSHCKQLEHGERCGEA